MNTTTPTQMQAHLNTSENDFNNIVIDAGFNYLNRQKIWTERGKAKFAKSPAFWSWWWKNWLAVDKAILENPLAQMAVKEYLRVHHQAHAYEMPRVMWRLLEVTNDMRVRKQRVPLKERMR